MFDIFINNYFVFFIFIIIIYYSFIFYLKDTYYKLIINIMFFLNIFEFLLYLNSSPFINFLYMINFILYSIYSIKGKTLLVSLNTLSLILFFTIDNLTLFISFIAILIICEVLRYLKEPRTENNVRIILYVFILISTLINKLYIGNVFFTLLYFIYLLGDFYIKDELTNTLNRKPLKRDLDKFKKQINAIISIDLNNLKKINDTMGHNEGDKAIITLVEIIKKNLIKNMTLYRVGGDEFLIICNNSYKLEIEDFIKKLKNDMLKTKYSCAIGVAYKEKNLNLDDLYKLADDAMYEDKTLQKSKIKL